VQWKAWDSSQRTNDLVLVDIKLIEGEMGFLMSKNNPDTWYVTLSHCWGAPKQNILKFTAETEEILKEDGIEWKEFSRTFQEVMLFASRLDTVRYM
jgi:hypothetical protein